MQTQKNKFISLLFLLFITGTIFPSKAQEQKDNHFEISKNIDILNAIIKDIEMFYVDTIDIDQTVKRGIAAMLGGLDPYTEYIPEEEMDRLQFMTTGEYGGIGSYIRQRPEGGVYIMEPFEGMPAAEAGLKPGDQILKIDTIDVKNATSERVSSLLKGAPNTKMVLTIQKPFETKPCKVSLTRKQVLEKQVTYYGVRGDGIGYIYLKGFTDKSAQEVKDAFEELKKKHHITSLIFDLRNNGGGVLQSAAQIVGMFVPKGKEVVSTRGKFKQFDRTYRTTSEPLDTVIPMAVLINGSSASAAEILSGSLQDMDRAVLIGTRSYGKGLVQSTRELPYEGNLKVTMSKYYIPSGRCIQLMDYTHRKADGTVEAIPDSLTSVFHTANGRPVRDGGGITPDFTIEEPEMPTMMFYLMTDFLMTDFIAQWAHDHKEIASPEEFTVTDEDFEALKKFAKEKNFKYDRQSEKLLNSLKEVSRIEGYMTNDSTLFEELEKKLLPNLEEDFDLHKDKIKKLLAGEIMKYYYYQRGSLIESLKGDKVMDKAMEVLSDPALYQKTLSKPEEKSE